jgi:hypothetical protein
MRNPEGRSVGGGREAGGGDGAMRPGGGSAGIAGAAQRARLFVARVAVCTVQ